MKFSDIPQFPRAHYTTEVEWRRIETDISANSGSWEGIDLNPDFQRGHVWTDAQRSAFVEYGLMGGESSMIITANHPNWMGSWEGPYELIDGLQRVTAVRMFMRNEIPAFGHLFREYEDRMPIMRCRFSMRILTLKSRADVLKQYLRMNAGGVVHSPEEIARVRKLLEKETGK